MKLQLHNVSFSYYDDPFIQNISLSFSEKDGCVVICGKNGAGKSTLLNIISELLPYRGTIIKEEVQLLLLSYKQSLLERLSVRDNLVFHYRMFYKQKLDFNNEEVVKILDVLKIDYLDQKIQHCSSGQQKKVALACLLLSQANVFILDEPFVALDYYSVGQLIELLQEWKKDKLFIITTHDFELAKRLCDRLIVMDKGTIRMDTIDKNAIQTYLGVHL